jgi:Flp pilus assembly pilin Flp
MLQRIHTFLHDESGTAAIEYTLISGLIAIPLIVVLSTVGVALSQVFTIIANALGGY